MVYNNVENALITAAFHCSRGGNAGCEVACPVQYDEKIAIANIRKMLATHRR